MANMRAIQRLELGAKKCPRTASTAGGWREPNEEARPMTDRTAFPLSARPTTYKGILMRSRLEAEYAASLDRSGPGERIQMVRWAYEPMCFASAVGQYLPDFVIDFNTSKGPLRLYVEIKAVVADPEPLKRRMEIIWESEPDVQLMIDERRGERRVWTAKGGSPWRTQ